MTYKITPEYMEITKAEKVTYPFILRNNEFGEELIAKSNELFKDTSAYIETDELQDNQEIPNMYILKRLALITTIYKDQQLRSYNLYPITPLQSEQLLKAEKLPNPSSYWEDLTLILYDTQGRNQKEATASYESLKQHRVDLELSISDLESRLLIVSAGLEKDSNYPHGVKPVILPGLTKAYPLEILKRTGKAHNFEYGLEQGMPSVNSLTGSRTLYMPHEKENIGLRVLVRGRDLSLCSGDGGLVDSYAGGRVNFAACGAPKK